MTIVLKFVMREKRSRLGGRLRYERLGANDSAMSHFVVRAAVAALFADPISVPVLLMVCSPMV